MRQGKHIGMSPLTKFDPKPNNSSSTSVQPIKKEKEGRREEEGGKLNLLGGSTPGWGCRRWCSASSEVLDSGRGDCSGWRWLLTPELELGDGEAFVASTLIMKSHSGASRLGVMSGWTTVILQQWSRRAAAFQR